MHRSDGQLPNLHNKRTKETNFQNGWRERRNGMEGDTLAEMGKKIAIAMGDSDWIGAPIGLLLYQQNTPSNRVYQQEKTRNSVPDIWLATHVIDRQCFHARESLRWRMIASSLHICDWSTKTRTVSRASELRHDQISCGWHCHSFSHRLLCMHTHSSQIATPHHVFLFLAVIFKSSLAGETLTSCFSSYHHERQLALHDHNLHLAIASRTSSESRFTDGQMPMLLH